MKATFFLNMKEKENREKYEGTGSENNLGGNCLPEVEKYVIVDDHKILKINNVSREPKRMLAFDNEAK